MTLTSVSLFAFTRSTGLAVADYPRYILSPKCGRLDGLSDDKCELPDAAAWALRQFPSAAIPKDVFADSMTPGAQLRAIPRSSYLQHTMCEDSSPPASSSGESSSDARPASEQPQD